MMNKLVSVIVPTFNRELMLPSALNSVLTQTYSNWECLIVDDGSSDGTLACADLYTKKDARFRLFSRDREPKNANTCRNTGLEKCQGEFVIFLDSDDFLEPHCLERRVQIASENYSKDFWIFKVWKQDGNNRVSDSQYLKPDADLLCLFLEMKLPWLVTSPLWNKTFLQTIGGFDENFERLQDVELHIRAILNSGKGFYIDADGEPDWSYNYRPFTPEQRNITMLQRKMKASLDLSKKLADTTAHLMDFRMHIQTGISHTFLKFVYENALNDFIATDQIKSFVEELDKLSLLDTNKLKRMRILLALPRIFYKLPASYRIAQRLLH